jgi:hypothetical protein
MNNSAARSIQARLVLIGIRASALLFRWPHMEGRNALATAYRPAGIFMSLLVTVASSIIATTAAIRARSVQNTLRRSEGSRK